MKANHATGFGFCGLIVVGDVFQLEAAAATAAATTATTAAAAAGVAKTRSLTGHLT